jgi:hypothetical protein
VTSASNAAVAGNTAPRKAPVIDPACVRKQHEGAMCFQEWFVRLPADATLQDLNEPSIWKNVQGDYRRALSRFDRVHIVSWDDAWLVDAVVADASLLGATLAGIRKVDLPPRVEPLLETELYRTIFRQGAYVTIRKATGQEVTLPETSKLLAERRHADLYPRRA